MGSLNYKLELGAVAYWDVLEEKVHISENMTIIFVFEARAYLHL